MFVHFRGFAVTVLDGWEEKDKSDELLTPPTHWCVVTCWQARLTLGDTGDSLALVSNWGGGLQSCRKKEWNAFYILAWFQPYGIKKRQISKSLLIFSFLSHLYYTDTRKGTSHLFINFYHQHWKFVVLCKVSICFIEKSLTIGFMRPVVSLKSSEAWRKNYYITTHLLNKI